MGWINAGHDRSTTLAALPDMAEAFEALYASLWQQTHIPVAVLELCRLRLAQLHCSPVDAARNDAVVPQEKRVALSSRNTSTLFTQAEKDCLAFAEVYAMDTSAITDAQADAVKHHFGDAGLVALIEALGLFDGMTRLSLLWQLPAPQEAGNER